MKTSKSRRMLCLSACIAAIAILPACTGDELAKLFMAMGSAPIVTPTNHVQTQGPDRKSFSLAAVVSNRGMEDFVGPLEVEMSVSIIQGLGAVEQQIKRITIPNAKIPGTISAGPSGGSVTTAPIVIDFPSISTFPQYSGLYYYITIEVDPSQNQLGYLEPAMRYYVWTGQDP